MSVITNAQALRRYKTPSYLSVSWALVGTGKSSLGKMLCSPDARWDRKVVFLVAGTGKSSLVNWALAGTGKSSGMRSL